MRFTLPYEGPHNNIEQKISLPVGQWRHRRPVHNWEKCCHCGLCYLVCPTGCIQDLGKRFMADLAGCKGCGTCAAECPLDAIAMVLEEEA